MTANIYDLHRAAFAQVEAYVILDKGGTRVATVAFKHPRDGAGRLFCYLHILGTPMVRAYAGGGGYDKHSAAAHAACKRVGKDKPPGHNATVQPETCSVIEAFRAALTNGGYRWSTELENAGFTVLQAV
jgi:hypothetical protein